ASAAQVEALVDRFLEFDGAAPALGVATRELIEPARTHTDVRDLVSKHIVDRLLDDRVADLLRDVNQLIEDVAREPFEAPIDAGEPWGAGVDAGAARGGVCGAGAPPQDRRFGELADATAEVLEQAEVGLDVPRLIPHLSGHVERELPRGVRKIVHGAAGALHG